MQAQQQIINPSTGRSVKIASKTGKTVIAQYLAYKCELAAEDISKLKVLGIQRATSRLAASALRDALGRAKQRISDRYFDETHKKYCSSSSQNDVLTTPNIVSHYKLTMPTYSFGSKKTMEWLKGTLDTSPFELKRLVLELTVDSHNEKWMLDALVGKTMRVNSFHEYVNNLVDMEWYREQNKYIHSLPFPSLYAVRAQLFD